MWISLIGAFLGLIATALLAALTAWFQYRSWQNQDDVKAREKARQDALSVVHEISELLGKRIHRQKRYLWSIRGPKNCEDAAEYRNVLLDWNDRLGNVKARIMFSYGRETMNNFESMFHVKLATAHEKMSTISERDKHRDEIEKIQKILDDLGQNANDFCENLLERAKSLDIEDYTDRNEIRMSNRRNLSVVYLTRRLFGFVD